MKEERCTHDDCLRDGPQPTCWSYTKARLRCNHESQFEVIKVLIPWYMRIWFFITRKKPSSKNVVVRPVICECLSPKNFKVYEEIRSKKTP